MLFHSILSRFRSSAVKALCLLAILLMNQFTLGVSPVFAQSPSTLIPEIGADPVAEGCGDLGQKFASGDFEVYDLPCYATYLVELLIYFAGLIAVLFVVVGGYQYIIGGVSDDKEAGKKTISYALGGLVITIIAWTVVNFFQVFITSGSPEYTHYEVSEWGEWSECEAGQQKRVRTTTEFVDSTGPTDEQPELEETQSCEMPEPEISDEVKKYCALTSADIKKFPKEDIMAAQSFLGSEGNEYVEILRTSKSRSGVDGYWEVKSKEAFEKWLKANKETCEKVKREVVAESSSNDSEILAPPSAITTNLSTSTLTDSRLQAHPPLPPLTPSPTVTPTLTPAEQALKDQSASFGGECTNLSTQLTQMKSELDSMYRDGQCDGLTGGMQCNAKQTEIENLEQEQAQKCE